MPARIGVVLAVTRRRVTADDLLALDPELDVRDVGDADGGPVEGVEAAEIFIGNPSAARTAELLSRMPRLRWFHAPAAGVDRYVAALGARPDVVLTNTRSHGLAIGEFVIATVYAIAKGLGPHRDAQRRQHWAGATPPVAEVAGATLCVVGLGAIGREVARLASAVGMRVIGVRRGDGAVPGVSLIVPATRLREVVAEADYVVLACPLTPQTRGLIDAAVLTAFKPTAWLINVARGEVVQQALLLDAVRSRRIGGAAIDVFPEEPLRADNPWWDLENVLLSPHRAASSDRSKAELLRLIAENLRRYRRGGALQNVLDRTAVS